MADKTISQLSGFATRPLTGLELFEVEQHGDSAKVPALALAEAPRGTVVALAAAYIADMASTADSDPGAGKLRWNHATPGSATVIFLDDATSDAVDMQSAWTALANTDLLYVQHATSNEIWQKWQISAVTDASGYVKLTATLLGSAGTWTNGDALHVHLQKATPASTSPVGRHMVPIMAASMSPRQTNGCAALAYISGATDQPDVPYLAFDSSAVEYAEFLIGMPPSWDEGTFTFVPRYRHPSTTTNFGVTWKMRALAVSNDDAMAANFGTAQASNDTGGTTGDAYTGPESSAITIAGTPAANDLVLMQIYRDPLDGGDTMAVDAFLLGVDIYLTTAAATD